MTSRTSKKGIPKILICNALASKHSHFEFAFYVIVKCGILMHSVNELIQEAKLNEVLDVVSVHTFLAILYQEFADFEPTGQFRED